MTVNSFHKEERLKSRKSIELLFKTGRSYTSPPLRMFFKESEPGKSPVRMAVAVPRRIFKRAVDRNLLKRRIREAYRNQKHELYSVAGEKKTYDVLFLYQSAAIEEYKVIQSALMVLLKRLQGIIQSDNHD